MSRPATTKLKCNAPLGEKPELCWIALGEIGIDYAYQRGLEAGASQSLIRKIAVHWEWGLCQPLALAQRSDGKVYVVDGQHRLAAAKLRGDIDLLPCVVRHFANYEDEAAAFVALNQQRRPLSKLDLFKAALAGGDMEAAQIAQCLEANGLSLAKHTNYTAWKPGELAIVGGLQRCYRVHGIQVLDVSLAALAAAFHGQVLQYAGSIFPGVEAVVAMELKDDDTGDWRNGDLFELFVEMLQGATQNEWYREVSAKTAEVPTRRAAAAALFLEAWGECLDGCFDIDEAA